MPDCFFFAKPESQIGIINQVADAIHDKRHPSYVKHQIVQLLTQRVFQIASGYEDANDSNDLKNAPILKISCDKDDPLVSQLPMCRFENATSHMSLYSIGEVLVNV